MEVEEAGQEDAVVYEKNGVDSELTHNEIWDDSLLIQHYDESMNKARRLLASKLSSSSVTDSDCSNSHRTELVNGFTHGKLHTSNLNKKKKKKKGRKKNEWHTGDPCRACYSADGHSYEATILGINNATGTCTVRYLGYNNIEDVAQSSLLKSKGEGVRKKQMQEAVEILDYSDETNEDSSAVHHSVPPSEAENVSPNSNKYKMPPPEKIPSSSRSHKREKAAPSIPYIPHLQPPPALGLVDGPDPMSSEALHTMLMSWYMTGYHTGYYQGLNHGKTTNFKRSNKTNRNHSRNN